MKLNEFTIRRIDKKKQFSNKFKYSEPKDRKQINQFEIRKNY